LAGYLPRWYTRPKTVTHPSTNRVPRALTSFMRRLPLTTTPHHYVRELTCHIGSHICHPTEVTFPPVAVRVPAQRLHGGIQSSAWHRGRAGRDVVSRRRRGTVVALVVTWLAGVALDSPNHVGWSSHRFDAKTQKCLWNRTDIAKMSPVIPRRRFWQTRMGARNLVLDGGFRFPREKEQFCGGFV